MSFSDYTFRPTLTATVLSLLAVAVFTGLSIWQVERAWYKLGLGKEIMHMELQPPVDLNKVADVQQLKRYQPVSVRGRYTWDDYILVDNSIYQGKAGYQVVVPLKLEDSDRHVLVYAGWVQQGRTRSDLPEIVMPISIVEVHGKLDLPASRPVIVRGDIPNPEYDRVWMYVDTQEFSRQVDYTVMPLVVYQSADDPGQYARNWPAYNAKVGMHIGYAIHWAAFALAALAVYIWMGLKKEQ
ncbi:MAG TPA: hypothetical protein DDW55_07345 [Gammaproteobacteria bacterium]|nr:hypothetical protein [Gammaproteobacteria bacterium]